MPRQRQGHLSLISFRHGGEEADDAAFVRWSDISTMMARRVRLDNQGRIVSNVAHRVKPRSFANATHIVQRLPVTMWKNKSDGRDTMPRWALLLRKEIQARYVSGPVIDEAPCALCGCAQSKGMELYADKYFPKYMCRCCLRVWHSGCAFFMSAIHGHEITSEGHDDILSSFCGVHCR